MRTAFITAVAVLVTALAAVPASAQYADDAATWGVQGGVGIGYVTVPPDSGTTRKVEPTYNFGVYATTPFIGGFRFQPEVKYDHRDVTVGGITTKMNYLSVPLLLRSSFLGIFMTQGVAINWPMSVTIFDVDFKSAYTSPDIAVIIGVGKQVGRVSVEGRWDTGFRSLQKGIGAGGTHHRAITGVVSVQLNNPY